jgi:hypothetical protein
LHSKAIRQTVNFQVCVSAGGLALLRKRNIHSPGTALRRMTFCWQHPLDPQLRVLYYPRPAAVNAKASFPHIPPAEDFFISMQARSTAGKYVSGNLETVLPAEDYYLGRNESARTTSY